jgi:type II secretory pathway component PulF
MIAVFGLGFYVFNLFKATPEGRRKIDALTFKIPVFGDLQRQIILTQLTRTLSLMVGAGVPILEALNITSEVVGNTIIFVCETPRGLPFYFESDGGGRRRNRKDG